VGRMPWHEMKFWPARRRPLSHPPRARAGTRRGATARRTQAAPAGPGRPGGRGPAPPPASGARAVPAPARARPCARRPPWSGDLKYPLQPLCAFLRHTQTFLNRPHLLMSTGPNRRSRVRD